MVRWWPGDEGITPAIATVLMVVVIVAMAGGMTLAWKTHVVDEVAQHVPPVAFRADEARDVAQVVRLSGQLDWARDATFPGTCSPSLDGAPFPTQPGTPIEVGDELGCLPGQELVVAIAGTVMFRHSFD